MTDKLIENVQINASQESGHLSNGSGSFVQNMKLPIHRWFRYSAGFSAEWAGRAIADCNLTSDSLVLDPFAGSGTTLLAADALSISSTGVEAHPFITRIAKAKLLWPSDATEFANHAGRVLSRASRGSANARNYPPLLNKCFSSESLHTLENLRAAWFEENDDSPASELVWLAITGILRPSANVGTAQWQYILPNKVKKAAAPFEAMRNQIRLMQIDMMTFQRQSAVPRASLIKGDARNCPEIKDQTVDLVITSPPYANNYDYADATRLEMCFWGEIESWADLHVAVRRDLIVSSSQHASIEKLHLDEILSNPLIQPINPGLSETCKRLETERMFHGGKKHYHTMIAGYFLAMAEVWKELHRVCKTGAKLCFVIGDSAPYGIHVPVERWLAQLATVQGFKDTRFIKIRDRNIKWKNRKHRIPLHEGFLWVTN